MSEDIVETLARMLRGDAAVSAATGALVHVYRPGMVDRTRGKRFTTRNRLRRQRGWLPAPFTIEWGPETDFVPILVPDSLPDVSAD